MLEKEFVPYEQALALKELGFDEPCLAFYNHQSILIMMAQENEEEVSTWKNSYVPLGKQYAAPTFSQAFRWFREKHGLRNSITDFIDDETGIEWDYEIAIIGTDLDEKGNYKPLVDYSVDDETRKFKTYEEAELACLLKLIEIANEQQ
jgi:hypothetical protein